MPQKDFVQIRIVGGECHGDLTLGKIFNQLFKGSVGFVFDLITQLQNSVYSKIHHGNIAFARKRTLGVLAGDTDTAVAQKFCASRQKMGAAVCHCFNAELMNAYDRDLGFLLGRRQGHTDLFHGAAQLTEQGARKKQILLEIIVFANRNFCALFGIEEQGVTKYYSFFIFQLFHRLFADHGTAAPCQNTVCATKRIEKCEKEGERHGNHQGGDCKRECRGKVIGVDRCHKGEQDRQGKHQSNQCGKRTRGGIHCVEAAEKADGLLGFVNLINALAQIVVHYFHDLVVVTQLFLGGRCLGQNVLVVIGAQHTEGTKLTEQSENITKRHCEKYA